MPIQHVEEQIKRFLADETPSVLAICGKWGVGKTHFWNTLVQRFSQSEDTFKLKRYGYISLFGINSLGTLKSEIFTAIVDRKIAGKELTDLETVQENKLESAIGLGKKLASMFGPKVADLALRNSSSIAESVCFATIRKAVICIDDLERKSKSLDLKDVLGLASLLKEQKNCNSNSLSN